MSEFELTMSVPRDSRYAETVRLLAGHGAREAGADEGLAEAFGSDVERAAHSLTTAGSASTISVVLSSRSGTIEAVLKCGETVRITRSIAVGA